MGFFAAIIHLQTTFPANSPSCICDIQIVRLCIELPVSSTTLFRRCSRRSPSTIETRTKYIHATLSTLVVQYSTSTPPYFSKSSTTVHDMHVHRQQTLRITSTANQLLAADVVLVPYFHQITNKPWYRSCWRRGGESMPIRLAA